MGQVANILASKIAVGAAGVQCYTNSATISTDTTMSPDGSLAPGVLRWVDRSGGIPVGYPSYTFSMKRPKGGSSKFRIMEKVTVPVLNVTSPQTGSGIQPMPSAAFNLVKTTEWSIDQSATLQQREAFFSLCASLGADVVVASDGSPLTPTASVIRLAVVSGEPPFTG